MFFQSKEALTLLGEAAFLWQYSSLQPRCQLSWALPKAYAACAWDLTCGEAQEWMLYSRCMCHGSLPCKVISGLSGASFQFLPASSLTAPCLLFLAECMGENAVTLKNYLKHLLVASTTIYVMNYKVLKWFLDDLLSPALLPSISRNDVELLVCYLHVPVSLSLSTHTHTHMHTHTQISKNWSVI